MTPDERLARLRRLGDQHPSIPKKERDRIIKAAIAQANSTPIHITPEITQRMSELLGVRLELPPT